MATTEGRSSCVPDMPSGADHDTNLMLPNKEKPKPDFFEDSTMQILANVQCLESVIPLAAFVILAVFR